MEELEVGDVFNCEQRLWILFTPKGRLVSGGSVERQFRSLYLARSHCPLLSLSISSLSLRSSFLHLRGSSRVEADFLTVFLENFFKERLKDKTSTFYRTFWSYIFRSKSTMK